MIKERPILFSGAMVRAVLELIKTQTRRCRGLELVNEDPDAWELLTPEEYGTEGNPYVAGEDRSKSEISVAAFKPAGGSAEDFVLCPCPYGKTGDRLWVRESFRLYKVGSSECSAYRATADKDDLEYFRWKPSIHMPRWASRIQLEIGDIRVQRLQDISEADALAEGIVLPCEFKRSKRPARTFFSALWISINGVDSWVKSPWVWVVEFKTLEQSECPIFFDSGKHPIGEKENV